LIFAKSFYQWEKKMKYISFNPRFVNKAGGKDYLISMDKNLLCKECNNTVMDKAQEHGFVCKLKRRFCAYAARDHKGKREGNIYWQAFPKHSKISLDCKWTDLFSAEIPENLHRKNWEAWKRLALDAGKKDMVNYWTDTDACQRCKHLDGDWCFRMELPCTVNPYLTLQRGLGPGMACMGMGHDDGINQGEFDF
jgi:hypothetical protein